MNKLFQVGNLCIFVIFVSQWASNCSAKLISYEFSSNSIDDGTNLVTNIKEANFNSARSMQPQIMQKTFVAPSASARTSTSQGRSFGGQSNLENPGKPVVHYYSHRTSYRSSARTVESPSLSVDSGGKSRSSGLTQGIAKLLDMRPGYYADVYEDIDRRRI